MDKRERNNATNEIEVLKSLNNYNVISYTESFFQNK